MTAALACMIPSLLACTCRLQISRKKRRLKALGLGLGNVRESKDFSQFHMIENECMEEETIPDVADTEFKSRWPIERRCGSQSFGIEPIVVDMGAICSGCAIYLS